LKALTNFYLKVFIRIVLKFKNSTIRLFLHSNPQFADHKIKTEVVADTEDQKRDSTDSYSDSPGTLPSTVFLREGVPTSATVGTRPALGAHLAPTAFDPSDVNSSNPDYARAMKYVSKIKQRFKPQSPDVFM